MHIKSMDNAFSLAGKNAIVTGGNKGIGLGITTALASQGANVAIFARDETSAREVIKDLGAKYNVRLSFYKTDISDMQSCKDSVDRCAADCKSIDILVNNAGAAFGGNLLDLEEDLSSWFKCFEVDLHGAVRMCYHVCKHMRDMGKGGRVINITSNAGEICNKPSLLSYASAKAALNHFTRCFAAEVAEYGIRVNAIAPGFTFSNFSKNIPEEAYKMMCREIPIGRFAEAVEIGALAAFLAGDASDAMTGAVLTMDGGYSLGH
ncbi:MAG: SDR family oxidoreductase [Clostridiales bacterium]|nr:SDR family oxidoreductase [Clostridiales bacterium]